MRKLSEHKINPANDLIEIAVEEIEPRGEPVAYMLKWPTGSNYLRFQHGPIAEAGVNGLTNEALIAIVLDRLRYFNSGQFVCRENALAITDIERGLLWLHARTRRRMQAGTEGTHLPD